MSAATQLQTTSQDYLALERQAAERHEFLEGIIYAMAGGSVNHGRIQVNLLRALGNQLSQRPCEVFGSELKIHVERQDAYFYPDVSALCGPMNFVDGQKDGYTNPALIIEVLSPSTEAFDRKKKFLAYQKIASLQEYVLVSQSEVAVEQYRKNAAGEWVVLAILCELEDVLQLASIQCSVSLAEIYERVEIVVPQAG
jgi:Uma2 family endonuclease